MRNKKRYLIIFLLLIGIIFKYYIDYSNAEVSKTCNYDEILDNNVFLNYSSYKFNLKFYKESKDGDIMLSALEISKPFGNYRECKNYNVSEILKENKKFEFKLDDGNFKLSIGLMNGNVKFKKNENLFHSELIKDKYGNEYTYWYAYQSINIFDYINE